MIASIISGIVKPIADTITSFTGDKKQRERFENNIAVKQLEHKKANFGTRMYQLTLVPFVCYFYAQTILFFYGWITTGEEPLDPLFSDVVLLTVLGSILGISSLGKIVKESQKKKAYIAMEKTKEDIKENNINDFPDDGISQIKRHEGLKLTVYKDTVGVDTIGYGRNLRDRGLSENEAEYLLQNDIEDHRMRLLEKASWISNLSQPRRWVLFNMAFNLGVSGLLRFKNTLNLIEKGAYKQASKSMLQSKWAKQVGNRAKELSRQMATGEWENTKK